MEPLLLIAAAGLGLFSLVKKQPVGQQQQLPVRPPPATSLEDLLNRSQVAMASSKQGLNAGALVGVGASLAKTAGGILKDWGWTLGPIIAVAAFVVVALIAITMFILGIIPFFAREFRRQWHAIQDAVEMFSGYASQTKEYLIEECRKEVALRERRELRDSDYRAIDVLHRAMCLGFAAQWFDCLKKSSNVVSTAQFTAGTPDGGFVPNNDAGKQWMEYRGIFLSDDGFDAACYLAFYAGDTKATTSEARIAWAEQRVKEVGPPWVTIPKEAEKAGLKLEQFNLAYKNGRRTGNALYYLKMCSVLDNNVSLITLGENLFNGHFFSNAEELAAANTPSNPGVTLLKVTKLVTQTQNMPWPNSVPNMFLPPPDVTGVFADEIHSNGDFTYDGVRVRVFETISQKSPVFLLPNKLPV